MSEADKLFEKLGYKKDFFITYDFMISQHQFQVLFSSVDKNYNIKEYYYDKNGNLNSKEYDINDTSPELKQAIQMKCKELEWK